jgi:26S proteasome regulatory subunit T3
LKWPRKIADQCSTGIVQSSTGSNYVVRILSTLDREKLKPSSSVALHRHSNSLVDILPPEADSSIAMLGQDEKPDVTYADVGGLDMQKQEIREAVELPLTVSPSSSYYHGGSSLEKSTSICISK